MKNLLIVISVIFVIKIFFIIFDIGIGINVSESMKKGLYLMTKNFGEINRGDIVAFCPEENLMELFSNRNYIPKKEVGKCYNKYSLFIKKVIGKKGDLIEIKQNRVYINSFLIKNSKIFNFDNSNRDLKHLNNGFKKVLSDDEFFLFADGVKYSLDSRYLGIIKKNKILNKSYFLWGFK